MGILQVQCANKQNQWKPNNLEIDAMINLRDVESNQACLSFQKRVESH